MNREVGAVFGSFDQDRRGPQNQNLDQNNWTIDSGRDSAVEAYLCMICNQWRRVVYKNAGRRYMYHVTITSDKTFQRAIGLIVADGRTLNLGTYVFDGRKTAVLNNCFKQLLLHYNFI